MGVFFFLAVADSDGIFFRSHMHLVLCTAFWLIKGISSDHGPSFYVTGI